MLVAILSVYRTLGQYKKRAHERYAEKSSQEATEKRRTSFSSLYVCSCTELSHRFVHLFAPGKINRWMPSVSFISWKLITNRSGTFSSFM